MKVTITQAKQNRLARRQARTALVATRTAAHAAHRNSRHTVASHLRSLGVDEAVATGMASTLRKKVAGAGTRGFALKAGARRACTRYTQAQVLAALVDYRPRKAEFKAARAELLALAA
ncbi:hypothetical protein [Nocardiopsis nanhaiensis]